MEHHDQSGGRPEQDFLPEERKRRRHARLPRVAPPPVSVIAEHHDIQLAALVALTLPGAGQLYNGQTGKGLIVMVLSLIGLALFATRLHYALSDARVWGMCLMLWMLEIVDAGVIAARLVRRERVQRWQWF